MKIITFLSCLLGTALTVQAQYFGKVVYLEGFDSEEFNSSWQQTDESVSVKTTWKSVENSDKPFSLIDPTSTASAELRFTTRDTRLSLVSPTIDLTDKSGLQVGFYAYDLNYCLSGEDFRFSVTGDDGATWHDLFSMQRDQFSTISVNDWKLYRYNLPEEFEGKRIKLRFYLDASQGWGTVPRGLPGYIDGLFISERPEVDPAATGINFSQNDRRPTTDAFGTDVPVEITFLNNGTAPLSSATIWYTVNDGSRIEETYSPASPLEPKSKAVYRFKSGADLSLARGNFSITCGVDATGDPNTSDNTITGYAENLTASIPYIPDFINEADYDSWQTDEAGYAYWEYDDWEYYWYIEPEYERGEVESYLISRPVWLEKGKTYRLQFSAMTDEDEPNRMSIYASTSADASDGTEIWDSRDIGQDNTINQTAVYACEATGPCYFIFKCYSEEGTGMMMLKDIEIHRHANVDAAIVSIESPEADAYTYSAEETLGIVIANKGANTIAAGNLALNYTIDGENKVTERLSSPLASGESIRFTFHGKLDLSDPGRTYELKVWSELAGDEASDNDTITTGLTSIVTKAPYIPDFGTSAGSPEVGYWTVNDRNNDGYKFTTNYDSSLDTRVFCFGGGMIGTTMVTVPAADEQLLSRPIKLDAGSYKFVFMSTVGVDGASMPLDVILYKETEGSLVKASDIWSGEVDNLGDRETVTTLDIKDGGIYRIGFEVVCDKPLNYRIYLGGIRLTPLSGIDLSIEEILLPTDRISSINSMPVGIIVRNNGTETATSISIKATSPSSGTTSCTFDKAALEPDGTYEIYFPEDIVFDSATHDSETLTVTVDADNDGYDANNTATRIISYREAETVPYNPEPSVAMDEWILLNHNRDLSRFRKDLTLGRGYRYSSDGSVTAGDILATTGISLEKDKVYAITFSYYTGKDAPTTFRVYALEAESGKNSEIVTFHEEAQANMTQCLQYFKVPASGIYNICFSPEGKATSLFVSSMLKIEEAQSAPDLKINAVKPSITEGVLGSNETVAIEFVNAGSVPLQGVPVSIEIGERVYHGIYSRHITVGDDIHSIELTGIDMETPAAYTLKAAVHVTADATPDDNEMSITVNSLPVVDVAVKGAVSPVSGDLGDSETVSVTVENLGKGDISGIKMSCSVNFANYPEPVVLEGLIDEVLPQGESMTYRFPGTVDMSEEGVYSLTVTATVEKDIDIENNSLTTSISSSGKGLDAGVSSINSPVTSALGPNEHIEITVTNYSEIPLYNVSVRVSVNRDNVTVASLEGVVTEIAALSDTRYTFNGDVDMQQPGEYVIEAYTVLPHDADSDNDACKTIVKCLGKDLGVTAILSPVSGINLGESEVTVEITNFGEAPVKDFRVSYQIGAMPQLATANETVEPGEKLIFTFPTKYEFTAYREYTVTARTMLPDDLNPDNDVYEVKISNMSSGMESVTEKGFSITPNPSDGNIHVACTGVIDNICIYNAAGQISALFTGIGETETDLSLNLPTGHYIVIVDSNGSRYFDRLIIRR